MLRHQGQTRTAAHNLRLAAMLSFAAGVVNICGVLAIHTLTTNVTGHFAFFAEELINGQYHTAFIYLTYIGAFLAGAFISSAIAEYVTIRNAEIAYFVPLIAEIILLAICAGTVDPSHPTILANMLLFSMGMQNSLVTRISSSVVRTTHLTGLFTDLGIELSQLFFYKKDNERRKLKSSLILRSIIIVCFFTGCTIGGFVFLEIGLRTLQYVCLILIVALFYDNIRYRYYFLKRKIRSKQTS